MPNDFSDTGAGSFDDFLARYLAGEQARQARSIDLSRFLTARTQEILQQAGRFALERGQTELDALHVLRMIVAGNSNKMVGQRLGITEGTVKNHVKNLLHKLGARSRVEAAVWAMQHLR